MEPYTAGVLQCGQCVAVCCSALQCVAVRCSVLQCIAVCCSALQCVAVCNLMSLVRKAVQRQRYLLSHLQLLLRCRVHTDFFARLQHAQPDFLQNDILCDYGMATISRLLKNIGLFAEYGVFYRAFLQKRPTILRSLLIVATPYCCGARYREAHTFEVET